ncbi:hypothetical protein H1R20_g7768, partial [Candolleomyces eurysporus]
MKSATASEDDNQDELRADTFELNYVVNWLTALISRSEGTASAGTLHRTFRFPCPSPLGTDPGDSDMGSYVTVSLRDVPLDIQDYGSVGAQTWGGACVLKLGAGTGLVSLVVTRIMTQFSSASSEEPKVEVVATEFGGWRQSSVLCASTRLVLVPLQAQPKTASRSAV